jgi:hypothetical protein
MYKPSMSGTKIFTLQNVCHFNKTSLQAHSLTHFQSYPHNAGEPERTEAVISEQLAGDEALLGYDAA